MEGFQRKENSLSIFFDVATAFDKVWHDGLIYKCINHGIPFYLIRIIKNFLEQRQFVLKINASFSRTLPIKAGVPKGGVLSPTLFSIFINDIPIKNNDKSKEYSMLFADDISYLISSKSLINEQKQIRLFLNELVNWMDTWQLSLAPHKCVFTLFSGDTRDRLKESQFNLKTRNVRINFDPNPKFLGIKFGHRMNGSVHIWKLRKKPKVDSTF